MTPSLTFTAGDETHPYTTRRVMAEDGTPFEITGLPRFDEDVITQGDYSLWRYRALIAPDEVQPLRLGTGWTPLVPVPVGRHTVHFKLEGLNPSGSFKDRGAALLVSVLKHMGLERVHDDSSGNAAAALAAYAARARLEATLFVPAYASPAKLQQITLYGAMLREVEGPRSAATDAALEYARRGNSYYASHAHNPFIIVANQTAAFEVWEQLGHTAPDVVILPVGHGTLLLGMAAGFRRLRAAGLITRLPRFIAVQAAACAPLWRAFHGEESGLAEGPTMAEGIRIAKPVRADAVMTAVSESRGDIVTVGEDEIAAGLRALARMGIGAEPTCAVVWPVLQRLLDEAPMDQTIVVPITGNGLKTPAKYL